jgi:hypothetical protein
MLVHGLPPDQAYRLAMACHLAWWPLSAVGPWLAVEPLPIYRIAAGAA